MASDPFFRVQLNDAEAIFMLGSGDAVGAVENVDVEVVHVDGSRWSGTFLSLAEIGRIMDHWRVAGEGLGGSYFQCPDLVIVRCGGIAAMVEVLNGLVDSGEFRNVLVRIDIEE